MSGQVKQETIDNVEKEVQEAVEAVEDLKEDAANADVAPVAKEEPKKAVKAPKVEKEVRFYRSRLSGLSISLRDDVTLADPSKVEEIRFVAKTEKFQGDTIQVGYLATDDVRAFPILENDFNVEEISEKEYNDSVK